MNQGPVNKFKVHDDLVENVIQEFKIINKYIVL